MTHRDHDRLEEICRRLNPSAHRGARDVCAVALEDLLQTSQREMVAVLRNRDVRQESGKSLVDDCRRRVPRFLPRPTRIDRPLANGRRDHPTRRRG
jgi:hypothetical protein